ncbi:S-layer protein [Anopheles bellator]|uniref:S-layer protein n=1 Tax=Anopheles bellator TaxID=139047 RepID=UPI00264722A9|nr:S-layer protein [Anopheles bellator]
MVSAIGQEFCLETFLGGGCYKIGTVSGIRYGTVSKQAIVNPPHYTMQWKKTILLCTLLVAVQAEPDPSILSAAGNLLQTVANSAGSLVQSVVNGLSAGTSGSLSASGSISAGASLGSAGAGAVLAFNSSLPILNLLNNVATSVGSALQKSVANLASAAGNLVSQTVSTLSNVVSALLGGVNSNLSNIGSGLSGAPTTANGNAVINSLNNVSAAVNASLAAASSVVGSNVVAAALGTLPAKLQSDLATAIQAINNATANPGTATTLLGALGPNGVTAIGNYLADAANVLYTTANIPLQLSTNAAVNATLNANAGVPYNSSAIAAVNSTVNSALTTASNVLNSAANALNNVIANVAQATNGALSTATSTLNSALNALNNVFTLNSAAKLSVTAATSQALNNITSLVTTTQAILQSLNSSTLNAVASANASISGNASAVIQPLLANLASTNATVVNCTKLYLPIATSTSVYYTTALGSCAVQATTVADILLANTLAVVNSAVTRLSGSTVSVSACLQALFPSTVCTSATVPNAPAYIANVALDVATIKAGEVVEVSNTAAQVAACTTGTANAAANDFLTIATAYNQCIGA